MSLNGIKSEFNDDFTVVLVMISAVAILFLFPIAICIRTFEKGNNNLNLILVEVQESLFSNCHEAIYFDGSWSNVPDIFKVNSSNKNLNLSVLPIRANPRPSSSKKSLSSLLESNKPKSD